MMQKLSLLKENIFFTSILSVAFAYSRDWQEPSRTSGYGH
jgi:hypothetical protein